LQIGPCDDENGTKHIGRVGGFAEIREKNGFARGFKPLTLLDLGFRVQATRELTRVLPEPKGFSTLLGQRHRTEQS
jgi:hypothetical protein